MHTSDGCEMSRRAEIVVVGLEPDVPDDDEEEEEEEEDEERDGEQAEVNEDTDDEVIH